MPIAKKQCWQCSNYNEGRCEEAAKYAKADGYPVLVGVHNVSADGDAANCQDYDLTAKMLLHMVNDLGYTVTFAPIELWEEVDEMQGDNPPDADPNAGIVTPPADPKEWAQTGGRGW